MKKQIFFPLIVLLCCLMAQPVYGGEDAETFFKAETAEVPIIMYHLVTKNSKFVGKYGITPTELESDLQYLKDNGYETVVMKDLIDFVKSGKNLPQKPIVLTFDDGNSSDYRYLYPLLQKYEMKAVVSVLGKPVDECTVIAAAQDQPKIFPTLTWEQIKEMNDSKYIEVQNHSYDLHGSGGSTQRKDESVEAYHNRLREDLTKMHERTIEMTGARPNTFTYPKGLISDSAQAVLDELGLVATLSCREGINVLKEDDMECLYRLKRNNRPSGVPVSALLKKIEKPNP